MVPREKLKEIAEMLLKRTKANEVQWGKVDTSAYGAFLIVRFPKSYIRVRYISPRTESDFVEMQVWSAGNEMVASLQQAEAAGDEEVDEDWRLLRDLYYEAFRSATNWDEVLGDVKNALSQPGPVGRIEM
jgi:hypothetical protein